jgi:hypothetical protein
VNPKTENFWVIDYRIFDPETDGLSKLDHVEEMLRSAEHRRMAFRTVLCSDGSCVSPTWDKSSEGGSMMNEPAVEPGRTMEALRAQARGGPEKLIYERVLPPSPGIGDVLLKVRAASFVPTELDWSSTWVDRAGNARPAPIPAHEVSGVVAALG